MTVFFNNQIARFKATPLEKRTLVVAVGCSLALLLRGNARMRTLLLLFPKISLRCDFWEPCLAPPICRTPAAFMKKGERTRFLLSLAKAKITLFAFAPCTARAVRRKRVKPRHSYNGVPRKMPRRGRNHRLVRAAVSPSNRKNHRQQPAEIFTRHFHFPLSP